MRKNFAALWEQWKALNLKLWNQATDQVTALQTEGTIAKNAQLFMASVLGRDDVSPFCIEDVKKLNKVLTKTKYFNLEKHSLKQELQTNLESTFLNNLIIQFLTAEKTEKNGKKSHSRIGYSFNFNSLSKEDQKFLKRKDDNNILIEIKELKNLFETRNPKYKKYAIVNYGITQGEKNYILNFYVSEIEEDEDFKNQLFNAKKTDPLKQLWLSSQIKSDRRNKRNDYKRGRGRI